MENWERAYKVVFGTPEYEKKAYLIERPNIVVPKLLEKADVDVVTIPSNARKMSNLVSEGFSKRGFTFTLDTTRGLTQKNNSDAERTTLTLYNLNKDSVDVLNQEGCVVRVFAGYQQEVSLAYSGDVVEVRRSRSGDDVIYKIMCKDGAVDNKNTKVSVDYAESVTLTDVIKDMVGMFPTTAMGDMALANYDSVIRTGGYVFQGKLISEIDRIMIQNNLRYGRYNGKITIVPSDPLQQGSVDYNNFQSNTFVFTEDNIKNISKVNNNGKKQLGDKTETKEIQINSFFTPIELGQFFTVPKITGFEEFAGDYICERIKIKLESHGNYWDVTLTGKPL